MSDQDIKDFLEDLALRAKSVGRDLFYNGADQDFVVSFVEQGVKLKVEQMRRER